MRIEDNSSGDIAGKEGHVLILRTNRRCEVEWESVAGERDRSSDVKATFDKGQALSDGTYHLLKVLTDGRETTDLRVAVTVRGGEVVARFCGDETSGSSDSINSGELKLSRPKASRRRSESSRDGVWVHSIIEESPEMFSQDPNVKFVSSFDSDEGVLVVFEHAYGDDEDLRVTARRKGFYGGSDFREATSLSMVSMADGRKTAEALFKDLKLEDIRYFELQINYAPEVVEFENVSLRRYIMSDSERKVESKTVTGEGLKVLQEGYTVETYASYSYDKEVGMSRELAFGPHGNLYISHWDKYPSLGHIYRISPGGEAQIWVEDIATPRRMAWGIGTEFGDYLYIADATPNIILQIDSAGNISTFASVRAGPQSVALDRSGAYGGLLYVATRNPDHICSITATGQVKRFSDFPGAVPSGHVDLTFDTGGYYDGLMYAALQQPPKRKGVGGIYSIDPNGNAEQFASDIESALDVEIDPVGYFGRELFVCGKKDRSDPVRSIWRVDYDGNVSEFAVGGLGKGDVYPLTFGPVGAMYVQEYSVEDKVVVIYRIMPASGR
jgi:hypothetical protein